MGEWTTGWRYVPLKLMVDEFRYAVRSLRRMPVFTIAAVVSLGLGIGANAAVFSVVYAVLLRPLPYPDPDRLVRLYETNHPEGIDRGDVSPGTFVDWRARSRTLEQVATFVPRMWLLAFGDEYEQVSGAMVSPSIFPLLGVSPALGRTFRPEAAQSPPFGDDDEVVISHGLWQRRYGGRETVLGEVVRVEGRTVRRIVGVMPRGFDFPRGTDVWAQETFLRPMGARQRQTRYHQAIARLRPGSSIDEASAELGRISQRLAAEHPASNAGFGVLVERLDRAMTSSVRPALLVLIGLVVSCVLLISCANVASLMVARAAARRHEMAVRSALGASVARLVRQSFADTLLLAAGGLAAGLLVAFWGIRLLTAVAPAGTPRVEQADMGPEVLVWTAGIALLSALIVGSAPALQMRSINVHETLKRTGRPAGGGMAARRCIIAGQVALTLVLVIATTVLLRSFIRLRGVDLGFNAASVLTADLRLPTARFSDRRPWFRLAEHYEALLDEVRAIPGVEGAGLITGLPLTGEGGAGHFSMREGGSPATQWSVDVSIISPDYLAAMGIPLVRGRGFHSSDRFTEPQLSDPAAPRPHGVAIINEAMAARFWPGRDPLGESIALFDDQTFASSRTIVGIVGSVRAAALQDAPAPAVFLPLAQHPATFRPSLTARTRVPPASLARTLRDRLRAFDSQMLVSNLQPLEHLVADAAAAPRFNLLLVGSFAALSLVLAAVGIYGVVAYLVTQRTREIGIRIALGALGRDVVRLVLGDGLRPVVAGLAAGAIAAAAVVRLMRGLLFEIAPWDPISFIIAPSVLLAVAAAAALLPARRATQVDPLLALRED